MPYWSSDVQCRVASRLATFQVGYPGTHYKHVPVLALGEASGQFVCSVPMHSQTMQEDRGGSAYYADPVDEGLDLYVMEFAEDRLHLPTVVQGGAVMSGGCPAIYDGERVSEYGFHFGPLLGVNGAEGPVDEHSGSGQLTSGVTYQWIAIYTWNDNHGVKHRSWRSNVLQHTVSADPPVECSFYVWNLTLTEKEDTYDPDPVVVIEIYRKGGTSDGFWHLEASLPNDKTQPYQYYTSSDPDSEIEDNEVLYTDGGVLDDMTLPPARHIVTNEDRVWLISADDPSFLWHSKVNGRDFILPGFNPIFIKKTDFAQGCTAIASLDDKLVVFKESSIYLFAGDPPNNLGQGGQLTGPVLLSVATGCIDPRSVCNCPAGVVFQARDGIFILTRGTEVQRIGGPVEDTLATYPTITSAVHVEDLELVLFTAVNSTETAGVTLAWHIAINEWTIWHTQDVRSTPYAPAVTGAMCHRAGVPRYHQGQADGLVLYVDPSDYTEHDSTARSFTVTTPWFQFAGVQGFEKVRKATLLGTYQGPHCLTIRQFYDFDDTTFAAMHSLSFDGVDDIVTTGGHAPSLSFEWDTDSWTWSAWIKTSASGSTQTILGKRQAGGDGWYASVSSAGLLTFELNGSLGSTWIRGSKVINDGKWHHVAGRWDADGTSARTNMTLWVDGRKETVLAGFSSSVAGTIINANSFTIGAMDTVDSPFEGNICQVAIWNSAITDAAVKYAYGRGAPSRLSSLAALCWWYMGDDDVYPNVYDSESGVDLVMTNMTAGDIVCEVPSGPMIKHLGVTEVGALRVGASREQVGIHIARSVESIRLEITATLSGIGTGRLVRWESLLLELGGKGGSFRLPVEARR